MKSFLILGLALVSMNAMASAPSVTGEATLTVYADIGGVSEVDVNDTGLGLQPVSSPTTLGKTASGYQGFYLGDHYWSFTCDSSGCEGTGPTQLQLTLTQVNGGYKLDGSINFEPVTLVVTNAKIDVSAGGINNTSFDLQAQANGSYTGSGATNVGTQLNTLDEVTFSATGSLANAVADPATGVVLLVLPFLQ